MAYREIRTLKVSLMVTFIIATLILPTILMAQVPQSTVNVGCGPIVIYPSGPGGTPQSVFNVGDSLYIILRLQSQTSANCAVDVSVIGQIPNSVTETLYSGSLVLNDYQSAYIPLINPISNTTPTGTWTIIVTITNPATGQSGSASFEVTIGTSSVPSNGNARGNDDAIGTIVTIIVVILIILVVMYLMGLVRRLRTVGNERRTLVGGTRIGVALYRLRLPNGVEIPVTEPIKVFSRETFEKYGVPPEALQFISGEKRSWILQMFTGERRGGHFRIFLRGNKWYIEDLNSTNGTLLNGKEIKGKGPQELKNGDIISPAGVLDLKFITEESTQVYTGR